MINIEVKKKEGENSNGILRRFTKKVQGSGVLPRIRGIRYSSRPTSKFRRNKVRVRAIKFKEDIEEQIKLGKMPMPTQYGRR